MCGKNFKKFDDIDCKISSFEVKKQVFQYDEGLDYLALNLLKLYLLHYRFLALNIYYGELSWESRK